MQPDLRFMDRLTQKPSKRNRDLILKYTVSAMLSCKHPTSLQVFSNPQRVRVLWGRVFIFFFFSS